MKELGNGWVAGPCKPTRWTNGMSRIDQQQRSVLAETSRVVGNPQAVCTVTHTMGSQMGLLSLQFWLPTILWGLG